MRSSSGSYRSYEGELRITRYSDNHGFLTVFAYVSGFGARHRRWYRLHGHVLRYWTNPDDEKRFAEVRCTQKVTIAPRLVCSRLNKLLLQFRRPASPDDVESLVLAKQGNTAIQWYLLSADCCDEWCAHLNKTLALLEAWGQTDSSTSC
ncbi:anillin-like [Wyeomyia smithii]|uniref:anillin-like n=1 Tax=Wyeomyia smithii TaxID=174621 RepID=UPI002467B992|nr:anillin-like [Wyeomyia smithii]